MLLETAVTVNIFSGEYASVEDEGIGHDEE